MAKIIALAGNPNSGKTTLFNSLTGANQYVGNWPGVTVEKKEGKLKGHKGITIADLPGIYSLSPYTLEEVVARDYIAQERPDAIINIVDGSNLERNLYLTTQVLECGIPTIIAINMMDVVEKNGDKIDFDGLSRLTGCAVVPISAMKGTGVSALIEKAVATAERGEKYLPKHRFGGAVEHALAHIEEALLHDLPEEEQRWYAVKIFEGDTKATAHLHLDAAKLAHVKGDIAACEEEMDDDAESIITGERYNLIGEWVRDVYDKKNKGQLTVSDKIDQIVTNRILGLPIFIAVMALVYYVSISTVGTMATDWVNDALFGTIIPPAVEKALNAANVAGWLSSLILDGIIAGVGAVLGCVPQMVVLFLFLAFLEGRGSLARIAFVMDRVFRKFGLSGKSFIPILIGTGCGVPGVMASRTIENERDRRMTVMTTTFIPCSAKLPIIALIAGAIFHNSGWVATSAYFIGIAAIVVSGIMLKKTKAFAGDPAPFVMELPAYHWPRVSDVLRSVWERASHFIKKAGTIILLSTIVIWFLQGFGVEGGAFGMVENMDHSILAVLGRGIAWLFVPLGWGTWRPAVAAITGLVAKENVVGTFGILYHHASDAEAGNAALWAAIAKDYTAISAFSFMVFNLLCAPCFAAIGAIKGEMGSAKWTWGAIGYQCGLAYLVSLAVYQLGGLVSGEVGFNFWTVIGIAVVVGIGYMLFRPDPNKRLLDAARAEV